MAAQLTTVTVAFPAIPDTAKLLPHADKLLPHGLFPTVPKQPEATFFEGSSGSIFIGLCMLLAIALFIRALLKAPRSRPGATRRSRSPSATQARCARRTLARPSKYVW